jgi:hypothetical protein
MTRKLLFSTFAFFAALSSGVASAAATEEEMMNTCLEQFVQHNFSDYQGKVTVKKPAGEEFTKTGPLLSTSPVYEIKMAAVGNPSGKAFATATCKLTRTGIVLKTQPLAALKKAKAMSPAVAKN